MARFVPKKNLLRLLEAYAGYRGRAGADAWHLVLLGDGELRGDIERRSALPDLAGAVLLPGFRQYDELPAYYGLARAFVHARLPSSGASWSTSGPRACRCWSPIAAAVPLIPVEVGVNGFTFDPYDVEELAG